MVEDERTVWRWFEEYRCGCVSAYEKRRRDLVGYCGKHGEDKRHRHRVEVSVAELAEDQQDA